MTHVEDNSIKTPMSETTVHIFVDGACRGNPGPGGWGVLLRAGNHERTLCGSEPETTNNRMELTAAIEGLRALKKPSRVVITTDSKYVLKGMTQWLEGWKRRRWRTAQGHGVLNRDLWICLEEAALRHDVQWRWVKGHSGNPDNELADSLARSAMDNTTDRSATCE